MSDRPPDHSPAGSVWDDADHVVRALAGVGYECDRRAATLLHIAASLGKPVLVEGRPGVGKSSLAAAVATAIGADLVRLQCYEGLDESKALYEWNYRKQLLALADDTGADGDDTATDSVFRRQFLIARPLLEALVSERQTVLLIDEIDRVDLQAEAFLLEVLAEQQMTIPELGTVRAVRPPIVFLTASGIRELSEALRRRCLPLVLEYPEPERERAIIDRRLPGIDTDLADDIRRLATRVGGRAAAPATLESADAAGWAATLVQLSGDVLGADVAATLLDALRAEEPLLAAAIDDTRGER